MSDGSRGEGRRRVGVGERREGHLAGRGRGEGGGAERVSDSHTDTEETKQTEENQW